MSKLNLTNIKNIIFDLGMVIINLDMEATDNAFKKLCGERYDEIMGKLTEEGFFNLYETGRISTAEFTKGLKDAIGGGVEEQEIADAWNAMLLDIPQIRFDILEDSKTKYRTFCLSNTNELHINFINEQLKATKGVETLEPYFEKVYLSHEMKQRKPDVEIFETVINDQNLIPEETLFIDDTAGHLIGAKAAGLNTFHLSKGITLEQLI